MSLTFTAAAARIEAQDRIRDLVQHSGDRLKVAFAAIGRRLGGMRPGRVKQIYYGEAGAVRAEEMDAIRETLSALSCAELTIVRGTLDGVAAHRIGEAVGWPEHRVRKWRNDRGLACDLSVGDQTRQAMRAAGRSGGRPIAPPTRAVLDALYGDARYRDVDASDVAFWRRERMASASKSGRGKA